MSARRARWWRPEPTRRPGVRSRVRTQPRTRDNSVTAAEFDEAMQVTMRVGELRGRKQGERDLYLKLGQLLGDLDALVAEIGSRYVVEQTEMFLMMEAARQRDPENFNRLVDAVDLGGEEGKQALEALAREWGIFPDSGEGRTQSVPPSGQDDDLMDVADAAGVTPLDDNQADEVGDDAEEWLANREEWLRITHEEELAEGRPCPLRNCRSCEATDGDQ